MIREVPLIHNSHERALDAQQERTCTRTQEKYKGIFCFIEVLNG